MPFDIASTRPIASVGCTRHTLPSLSTSELAASTKDSCTATSEAKYRLAAIMQAIANAAVTTAGGTAAKAATSGAIGAIPVAARAAAAAGLHDAITDKAPTQA